MMMMIVVQFVFTYISGQNLMVYVKEGADILSVLPLDISQRLLIFAFVISHSIHTITVNVSSTAWTHMFEHH